MHVQQGSVATCAALRAKRAVTAGIGNAVPIGRLPMLLTHWLHGCGETRDAAPQALSSTLFKLHVTLRRLCSAIVSYYSSDDKGFNSIAFKISCTSKRSV